MLAACGVERGWRAGQESPTTVVGRALGGGLGSDELFALSLKQLDLGFQLGARCLTASAGDEEL